MPKNYDRNDFAWSYRGGYILSHDGDFSDTKYDPLRSQYEEIRDVVKSDINSWKIAKNIGASLSDFVGEPNNKITAEAIKTRIISALTRNGLVNSEDLKVTYLPYDIDKLIIRISIKVAPTAANKGSNTLSITMGYSYSENNVFVLN